MKLTKSIGQTVAAQADRFTGDVYIDRDPQPGRAVERLLRPCPVRSGSPAPPGATIP